MESILFVMVQLRLVLKNIKNSRLLSLISICSQHKIFEGFNFADDSLLSNFNLFAARFRNYNSIFRNIRWLMLEWPIFWEVKLNLELLCSIRIQQKLLARDILSLHQRQTSVWNLIEQSNILLFRRNIGHDNLTLVWIVDDEVINFIFRTLEHVLVSMNHHHIVFGLALPFFYFLFENDNIRTGRDDNSSFPIASDFMLLLRFLLGKCQIHKTQYNWKIFHADLIIVCEWHEFCS